MQKNKMKKIAKYAALITTIFALEMAFIYTMGPTIMDRLENQRIAEHKINCKNYGQAMNEHYGRDVCQ